MVYVKKRSTLWSVFNITATFGIILCLFTLFYILSESGGTRTNNAPKKEALLLLAARNDVTVEDLPTGIYTVTKVTHQGRVFDQIPSIRAVVYQMTAESISIDVHDVVTSGSSIPINGTLTIKSTGGQKSSPKT